MAGSGPELQIVGRSDADWRRSREQLEIGGGELSRVWLRAVAEGKRVGG